MRQREQPELLLGPGDALTEADRAGQLQAFPQQRAGPLEIAQVAGHPHGIGTTTINGVNNAGDLVGFYVDAAGNTDGFLATP